MTPRDAAGLVGERALARREAGVIVDDAGTLDGVHFREVARGMMRWSRSWGATPVGARWDVALVTPQSGEALAAFTGLSMAGWAVGVVDAAWTPSEQHAAITQLSPSAVVLPADRADAGARLVAGGWRASMHPDGAWVALLPPARRPGSAPDGPVPDADFYVGFTSGSAGRPKAFARSHASWWASFTGLDTIVEIAEGETVAVPGPLSGSHFLFGALHALHRGADIDLRGVPGGRSWAGESAPEVVYVVPSLLSRMVEAGGLGGGAPRHLMCAGARLDGVTSDRVADRWPHSEIVEYYGASELSFVTIRRTGDGTPEGSVGRAFPGVEVTVRDDEDRPLDAGRPGRVFARGPLLFSGYRGVTPPSAAHRADDGAWTVGDMGHIDENGNLFVAGRGSALIITGGLNVQPEEGEEAVAACAGVAGVVVVGVDDPRWGEVVVAVVSPVPRATLRRTDLRGAVVNRLARAKRPRRYLVHEDPFPLLRSGKIDRPAVRRRVLAGELPEVG